MPVRPLDPSTALRLSSAALFAALLASCGPNYQTISNNRLEQVMKLENENTALTRQLADARATNSNLQDQIAKNNPPVPTLPTERLNQLFTLKSIEIRNITNYVDTKNNGHFDAIRVFVRTYVDDDVPAPVTGTLTVKIFDPDVPAGKEPLASETFTPDQLKKAWYANFGLNNFAFNIPISRLPQNNDVLISVKLVDALTGRVAVDDKRITLHKPLE